MKNKNNNPEISCLEEYINEISSVSKSINCLYRGQVTDVLPLPKLFRDNYLDPKASLRKEKEIIQEFKKRGKIYLDIFPENEIEWLSLAQHYGLITRLLDWTENALIALWFAINPSNYENTEENAYVYILNYFDFDEFYVEEKYEEKPYNIQGIGIYRPSQIFDRIITQSGIFTLHSNDEYGRFDGALNDIKYRISKIKIKSDNFERIRDQLKKCGINDSSVFPDLDGLSKFLNGKIIKSKKQALEKKKILDLINDSISKIPKQK